MFFIILILLSGTASAVALQVCHLDPSRGPQGEEAYELFCNSDDITQLFREAHIDEKKNSRELWDRVVYGFSSVFDSEAARELNQRYFISSVNRGKAIALLRKHGFESRNNMEFTRRKKKERIQENKPLSEEQKKRKEKRGLDLDAARRARHNRIQNP